MNQLLKDAYWLYFTLGAKRTVNWILNSQYSYDKEIQKQQSDIIRSIK